MKTKTHVGNRRQTGQWLLVGLSFVAFVMVYAWVFSLALYYPKVGNIGLAVVTTIGIAFAHYLFSMVDQNPAWRERVSTVMVLTYVMLVLFAAVHLSVGLVIQNEDILRFVVYAPVTLLGATVILSLLRWLMNTTKEFRKSQL